MPPRDNGQQHQDNAETTFGYPNHNQSKLSIRDFDGRETYKGLGAEFEQWGLMFIGQVDMTERACGFKWSEEVKLNKLAQHLAGKAGRFFREQAGLWWAVCPFLFYALEQMNTTFTVRLSMEDAARLFTGEKIPLALMRATDASPAMVLQNIVRHASPSFSPTLLGRFDERRVDVMLHAQELVQFAQRFDTGSSNRKTIGKDVVGAVTASHLQKSDSANEMQSPHPRRTCYNCKRTGHIARHCSQPKREKSSDDSGVNKKAWALSASACDVGESGRDDSWIVDSGASRHLVNDLNLLWNVEECEPNDSLTMPNGNGMRVTKKGSATLESVVNGDVTEITLSDVFYAPALARNLLSFGKLFKRGCSLVESNGGLAIANGGEMVFPVKLENDVLITELRAVRKPTRTPIGCAMSALPEDLAAQEVQRDTLMSFHERFGHLAYDTVERIARTPHSGIAITDHTRKVCITCAEGKQTKRKQSKKDTGKNAPIERVGGVICSDLKGPMTPRDRHGNRYFVNFIDDKSNYCRVFASKTKDEAARKFKELLVFFEKAFSCKIHVLRTDGGVEYRNVDMFCKEEGVSRQISEASNQASNGKAERMHRTILNMVRCMIFGADMAPRFWGDYAEYATFILNRSPTRANEGRKSPIEVLTGKVQSLRNVLTFGVKSTVRRDQKKKSLKKRAVSGRVIGKSESTKGYIVYLPSEGTVTITEHVANLREAEKAVGGEATGEYANPEAERPAANEGGLAANDQAGESVKGTSEKTRKLRRSTRTRRKSRKQKEADEAAQSSTDGHSSVHVVLAAAASENTVRLPDPKNYREAHRSEDAPRWSEAEKAELAALIANSTWTLVKCTPGTPRLHSKWVHKKKLNAEGASERYKARLVACGNEQTLGVNYTLTFAAVLEMTSSKAVLALARIWGIPARHGDAPNAYVKAMTEEGIEIILYIPEGMEINDDKLLELGVTSFDELGLRLDRSLYGLKQAGRLWHQHLHQTLLGLGFSQCITDTCLYFKKDADGTTVVGTYVDALLVTGTSVERVDTFFAEMEVLSLKDLGPAAKFLGVRISYDEVTGYSLDQEQVIKELLAKHGLANVHAVRCPIGEEENNPSPDVLLPAIATAGEDSTLPTIKMFQSFVGSLLWIASCTRPDISFAVQRATRRTHAPTMRDWKLAKRIARYLAGTMQLKLHMRGQSSADVIIRVACYTDVDFGGDKEDRKSVSGVVLTMNGMVVGWQCKKQGTVALSTAEAEFVAASCGGQELLGLKELLTELGLEVELPLTLYIDNQAAIKQIANETSSGRAKHVDIRLKFLRDYAAMRVVSPLYMPTEDMIADLLTKALPAPRVLQLRTACGQA